MSDLNGGGKGRKESDNTVDNMLKKAAGGATDRERRYLWFRVVPLSKALQTCFGQSTALAAQQHTSVAPAAGIFRGQTFSQVSHRLVSK